MTISYNWLREYIDIPESPQEIAHVLTSTGLEVESVVGHETVKGGFKGLVIGQVLTCTKHPNADKLSLTTVAVGGERPLQIVCGAPNVAAGQRVVVAVPGTTIYPSRGASFEIKTTKIRGEVSEGMICAADEIGLGEDHTGIIVLNTDKINGTPASEFYDTQSDYIFEIGLTPNRADAASHIGVARDIKASLSREVRWPAVDAFATDHKKLNITIHVENVAACPRYSGVTISGIHVGESPAWLKRRLSSIGLTPINNIVDITNFVCHEVGQPLHAFDADQIKGQQVFVKTLPTGSKFVTLDNKERVLLENDLMICDAQEGMCIAGVFGGSKSGITAHSKNIFLESACFSPDYIRQTSLHHQLKTDASFRFERGTDPNITVYALKRAALLIREIAGGQISSEITDVYPSKIEDRRITLKDKNVNRLIGKVIPRNEVLAILKRLDIKTLEESDNSYTVSVPPYRVDVTQEADVVEEILRIYGFNNIELSNMARTDYLAEFPLKDLYKYKRTIGELLVANGFSEIWTNSLTNQSYQTRQNLAFKGEAVEILNKLSEEQGILRQSLIFTGLEVCAYNINRKQRDLKLYEFGKIYYRGGGMYREEERLAIYVTGNRETETWQHKTRETTYHDLAQHVHHILLKSGLPEVKQETIQDHLLEFGARLLRGKEEIGKLGKVKPAILKDFGIKQELFYAELDTSLLFQSANPKLVIQEVSKFPEVRRDVSLVLDKRVTFEEIRSLVMSTEKQLIKSIIAFDVYEGKNIPEGKKAYALAFTLLNEHKTLTDEEIEQTMEQLMIAFEQRLGAVIRK
ncbi:MAG: phenylalanine--tRNA ligase subunit beta [Cyclobacteriaceae bacterium]|nr:phenylalanine--tRNA ligase subunit beta [Cyclobacteriaceae bacterium]MDH4296421.1 phenylalanine--tRNA ligase subunit beta [Cyclobacteriaceae bacterium]